MSHEKSEFHEARISPMTDPLDGHGHTATEFPFAEVEASLDGVRSEIGNEYQRMAEGLREILNFVVQPVQNQRPAKDGQKQLALAGKRACALAWILSPDYFGGRSASQLSRDLGLG